MTATRAHRLAAYAAAIGRDAPPPDCPAERWVDTGQGDFPSWQSIAQAIADAEARGGLETAERAVVEAAMARYEHRNSVATFKDWTRAAEQKANDLDDSLDDSTEELLALRARKDKPDGTR